MEPGTGSTPEEPTVQQTPQTSPFHSTGTPGATAPEASPMLAMKDGAELVKLAADAGAQRNDARIWRRELLQGLMRVMPGSAAAAFVIKGVAAEAQPVIVSQIEEGFKGEAERQAFREEFNAAGFKDVLSRRALDRFVTGKQEELTALRSELVPDHAWASDTHVQLYRKRSGVDDCVISVARAGDAGMAYVLYVFRPAEAAVGEIGKRFGVRERAMMEALHRGLATIYRAEESTQRLNRAVELPPRLKQTLECLLAGRTERQSAAVMKLSVHTVHDYVKALYQHFGVSSKGELMSKWIQMGGTLPGRSEQGV